MSAASDGLICPREESYFRQCIIITCSHTALQEVPAPPLGPLNGYPKILFSLLFYSAVSHNRFLGLWLAGLLMATPHT